jgi:hypothetical protein
MSSPAAATTVVPELADAEALARLADWASLPKLGTSRIVRASSYQRPERPDVAVLLMPGGNADNNNFVCASRDAVMAQPYLVPPWLRQFAGLARSWSGVSCPEPVIRLRHVRAVAGAVVLVATAGLTAPLRRPVATVGQPGPRRARIFLAKLGRVHTIGRRGLPRA